jgi:metal-responsive CopG/Arc/MetJ family transcriptional regulator
MVLQLVIPRLFMGTTKIAISIDSKILTKVDKLVEKKVFSNRSKAIQIAVEEKITKIDKNRLAKESAKLNKNEEQSLSEEGIAGDFSEWPEY